MQKLWVGKGVEDKFVNCLKRYLWGEGVCFERLEEDIGF